MARTMVGCFGLVMLVCSFIVVLYGSSRAGCVTVCCEITAWGDGLVGGTGNAGICTAADRPYRFGSCDGGISNTPYNVIGFAKLRCLATTAPQTNLKSGVPCNLSCTPDFKFVCGAVVARHRRLAKPITLYGVLEIPP